MDTLKLEIKDRIETEIEYCLGADIFDQKYSNKLTDSLKALNTVIFDHTFDYMTTRFNTKAIKRISVVDWINHLYHFYNGLDQNNESTDYVR